MTKCLDCSKTYEEYKAQFPTTLYEGKTCEKCDSILFVGEIFP
jgi:hypothetical protein